MPNVNIRTETEGLVVFPMVQEPNPAAKNFGMLATFPQGHMAVNVCHWQHKGLWEFGAAFHRGKGSLFNTFTRYYIRPAGRTWLDNAWEGLPDGEAPRFMDVDDCQSVYDWIEHDTCARSWLEGKIHCLSVH